MALFLGRFLVKLGHVQKLVELMINIFKRMKWSRSFFCYSWFRLQSMAIHCNRRGVYTDSPHTSFFSCTVRMLSDVYHTTLARASFHLHAIHGERLSVCLLRLFLALTSSVCLSVFYLFSSTLYLHSVPEPLLPCGQRQGKHTLRLRQSRSLALWQNILLPHYEHGSLWCLPLWIASHA